MGGTGFYRGEDPKLRPAYGVTEAARILRMAPGTLGWWAFGRDAYEPVFDAADPHARLLSFVNLLEAEMLRVMTKTHGVRLPDIREALRTHQRLFTDKRHPLVSTEFLTDQKHLYIVLKALGEYLDLSAGGQLTMKDLVVSALKRVRLDSSGIRFFPHVPGRADSEAISVNPRVLFGRPAIAGTRIGTDAIASRVRAGETPESVAEDMDLELDVVTQAVIFEETVPAAA